MKTNILLNPLAAVFICVSGPVSAQNLQTLQKMDPQEVAKRLADNPPLFLQMAIKTGKWNEPAEPMHIAGPIYFVGTQGLSVWLVKSSEGLILLNTGMPESGPMIEKSVRKLGFKPKDIKLLLTGHAHIDHAGGHAYIKKLSGAQVATMDIEEELLESGGRGDFHYAAFPEFRYEPVNLFDAKDVSGPG